MFINEQYVGDEFHIAFDLFIAIHAMCYMGVSRDRDAIFSLCAS